MYYKLLLVILITIFTLPNLLFGQSNINIIIDTNCHCASENKLEIDGDFALYAEVSDIAFPSSFKDTLIQKLEFTHKQNIVLPRSTKYKTIRNFRIIFKPADTLIEESNLIVSHIVALSNINLNCFFFNKYYPSFLDQLDRKDTLFISSIYAGNTTTSLSTTIPMHILKIYRKRNKYFCAYGKTEVYSSQPMIYGYNINYETPIRLTEEQLNLVRTFETELWKSAVNNSEYEINLTTNSIISVGGKNLAFHSKGYISLALWNKIIETTAQQ